MMQYNVWRYRLHHYHICTHPHCHRFNILFFYDYHDFLIAFESPDVDYYLYALIASNCAVH